MQVFVGDGSIQSSVRTSVEDEESFVSHVSDTGGRTRDKLDSGEHASRTSGFTGWEVV